MTMAGMPPNVSTANLADASLRLQLRVHLAPPGLRPVVQGSRVLGRVRPVTHRGSVDVFLEALEQARAGEILVVDNQGRMDEGCIGDLVALETKQQGLAGILIWGLHRDTQDVRRIGLPVFSYGICAMGPTLLRQRDPQDLRRARFGDFEVDEDFGAIADDDGAVFFRGKDEAELCRVAAEIAATEQAQAKRMQQGISLRKQLGFPEYLRMRKENPELTFRAYLRRKGGAIEE
jgi:regulator of RNase E activity RraA